MQHSIFTLLLALSICLPSKTQAQDYFTVLVGNFVEVRPQDFAAARSLGFVYKQVADGNMQQVYVGNYTEQEKANTVANALRNQGFTNAQVSRRTITTGPEAIIIQIATRFSNRSINWADLSKAGDLNVMVEDERIKVMTGTFPDMATAQSTLPSIKALGFDDAFVKSVPRDRLLPVTSLSTGIKEDLIPLQLNEEPVPSPTPPVATGQIVIPSGSTNNGGRITTPNEPTVPRTNPADADLPPVTGTTTTINRPARPTAVTTTMERKGVAIPAIRGDIKRNSVINLQRLLESEGYYNSSLDGYYGNGTKTAYEQMLAQNNGIQKYRLLVPFYASNAPIAGAGALQTAIDDLPYSVSAPGVIAAANTATARAYQAYQLFISRGPSGSVDELMNAAIKQAYANTTVNRGSFDYRATYAYRDLTQLIMHVFYIHSAPGNSYTVPCWFSDRHPAEVARVNTEMLPVSQPLQWSSCDPFLAWEEIRLLQTIALDLNPMALQQTTKLRAAASERAALFQRTSGLGIGQGTILESWQQNLWQNIDRWSANDPFLTATATSLHLAYFQSLVRLEDYYMNKNFDANAARYLAIATIKAIAGVPLERFQ